MNDIHYQSKRIEHLPKYTIFKIPRLISTCNSCILLGIDTVGMLLQGTEVRGFQQLVCGGVAELN